MLGQSTEVDVFYDQGYDPGAWLCTRDSALRQYVVKNNRFLYHTAIPEEENWDSYANLHMAHNNSSAFLPERLKNGLQAISSEGLIASFFYQMYRNPLLQEHKALDSLYSRFGILPEDITPPVNLYLKMLYSLSGVNLTKPTLFTDFIGSYISNFPAEADAIADVFGRVTNFVTVDPGAGKLFGDFYRIGRLGDISQLQSTYQQVKALKAACKTAILSTPESLTAAVYPSIWITADKRITPVPWEPFCQIPLKFDINAATAIDFYALDCLTFAQCRQLEAYREQIGGFASLKAFQEYVDTITK